MPCPTVTWHLSKCPLADARQTDQQMQHATATGGHDTDVELLLERLTECFCPIPIITYPQDVLLGGGGAATERKRGRTAATWVSSRSREGAAGPEICVFPGREQPVGGDKHNGTTWRLAGSEATWSLVAKLGRTIRPYGYMSHERGKRKRSTWLLSRWLISIQDRIPWTVMQ